MLVDVWTTNLGLHGGVVLYISVQCCRTVETPIRSEGLVGRPGLRVPASTEVILVVVVSLVDHRVDVHHLTPGTFTPGFSTAQVEDNCYAIKNQLGHPKTQRIISCPMQVLYGVRAPIIGPFR